MTDPTLPEPPPPGPPDPGRARAPEHGAGAPAGDDPAAGLSGDGAGGPVTGVAGDEAGSPVTGAAGDGTGSWWRRHRARRRRRWPFRVAAAVVVVVAGLVIADHVDLNEYVLTPGDAQPVGPLIRVPAGKGHPSDGAVLLTDVYVTQVTALNYLAFHFDGNAQMVTTATLLGPTTPPDQMLPQGYIEMAQSQAAAKAAALDRLGYHVTERNAGALVFAVVPGSPASTALRVGQVITAVDGTPTADVCSFVSALAPLSPGTVVDLTVQRDRITSAARQVTGPTVHERVRLRSWPASVPRPTTLTCPGSVPASRSYLGVEVQTQQEFSFPFPIQVRTSTIGGPSAGLAMSLGIIDSLSGGHLTGGTRIAATGTIDPQGNVGDVGGVPQKTVAVEQAKATVFFVPADERATAVSKATPSLHVYGVSSLRQVLDILQRLGGTVPAEPANHRAGQAA